MEIHPIHYNIHGSFPYLNLARWYGVAYARVLNRDETLPYFALKDIDAIDQREQARKLGKIGAIQ